MAYFPSQRIADALAKAGIGLWVEALQHGRIAIVAKIPETVIKALHRGAKASLFIGVMPGDSLRFLCLGLRVNDEPSHPFTLTMSSVSPEDSVLLRTILNTGSATLHCINELDHPVLSAWCKLTPSVARKAGEALGSSDHWLLTPDSGARIAPSEISRKLDLAQTRFEEWIFGSRVLSSNGPAATLPVEIPLALDFWPRQTVIHLSPTLEEAFSIDDEAEGEKLERAVLSVVELLYPERAYRSPRIPEGTGTRELTDVLGFNDDWLCVIQAKALSVLGVADGRSSERRTSAVTKDITKGLKQLAGAMRKIRGSVPIYDAGGTPINIPDRNAPAHGIVLVSEMYSFVDWRAVAVASSDASEKAHMTLIHVFDLRELVSIANSSGATDRFNESLMQRWALVKKKGTAYVRARPRNAADPPPEEDWSQDK